MWFLSIKTIRIILPETGKTCTNSYRFCSLLDEHRVQYRLLIKDPVHLTRNKLFRTIFNPGQIDKKGIFQGYLPVPLVSAGSTAMTGLQVGVK
jgi:hypothetical protein